MNILDQLIQSVSRLPGLGKKSAARIAYHLLNNDERESRKLADLIGSLHSSIHKCSVCGSYTEQDPCEICTNPGRDRSTICVVEQPQDVVAMESGAEYHGLYHVLGGVIAPIDGIGPADLSINALIHRVQDESIQEVIIATNPTVEGDTTALYIARQLESTKCEVTRLALGLPVGGDLEYADRLTLARSIRGRNSIRER